MSAEAVAPAPAAALAFPALGKICLVTVGTTRFDSLIAALDGGAPQLIGLLQKQGIHRLVVQAGRSEASTDRLAGEAAKAGLELEVVDYVASLQTLIEASELVISHAGAGTILEVSRAGKRLMVVVNEQLMHNHQRELAEAMAKRGHLFWCCVPDLLVSLQDADWANLKPLPPPEPDRFARLVDEEAGRL